MEDGVLMMLDKQDPGTRQNTMEKLKMISQQDLANFLLSNADLLSDLYYDRSLLAAVKMQVANLKKGVNAFNHNDFVKTSESIASAGCMNYGRKHFV